MLSCDTEDILESKIYTYIKIHTGGYTHYTLEYVAHMKL